MSEQGTVRKGWVNNFFQTPNGIYEMPISGCAKAVYIYLCRCADREGQSFPSYRTIAEAIGWGRTKVAEALSELDSCGLLTRQEQFKENGARDSNLYTVIHPDDVVLPSESDQTAPPSVTRTTPVHEVNYPRSPHGQGPSARRTVTIHKEQYSYNNTQVTTHTQSEIAASTEASQQHSKEQTERVCEEVKNALLEQGIKVQAKTVQAWLGLAPADDVLYAAQLALQDAVRNPAGFVEGVLKRGVVRVEKKPERDPRYEAFYRVMGD